MIAKNHKITIRELSAKEEMLAAYPLLSQMYEKMSERDYVLNIEAMIQANDFKMVAAFEGDEMVGVAGYWVLLMLYCGRYIQVSSFLVNDKKRKLGIGKKILDEIEKIGRELGCQKIVLDSYTENKKSHSLYYRENFYIRGLHFMKDL